ncbi:MAG TPA: sulfate ABC transporter permease subunit CysT [Rariglobus sp.]|jgi:sulfate transport system permease protein|nr:sulfate ABC transporter permease subunit CysT [Rariglobus sp.]
MSSRSSRSVLPGFGLSLGFTIAYLSLIVLVPLAAAFIKTSGMTWREFVDAVASPQVLASYRLSFGISFLAAGVNAFFGLIVAWVLVRYPFLGRRIVDAVVDLPFALPTAVAGIALTAIYARNGWLGFLEPVWGGVIAPDGHVVRNGFVQYLDQFLPGVNWGEWLGLKIAFDRPGIFIALTFIGLPFVVRTLQPVLEELEPEFEEASATLGATRWQTIRRVIFPQLLPALITGFTLSFARALGEYGSVVFIAGNKPLHSEITPLLIMTKLEQFDYRGATAIAVVLLVTSFTLLLLINLLQSWTRRHQRA